METVMRNEPKNLSLPSSLIIYSFALCTTTSETSSSNFNSTKKIWCLQKCIEVDKFVLQCIIKPTFGQFLCVSYKKFIDVSIYKNIEFYITSCFVNVRRLLSMKIALLRIYMFIYVCAANIFSQKFSPNQQELPKTVFT